MGCNEGAGTGMRVQRERTDRVGYVLLADAPPSKGLLSCFPTFVWTACLCVIVLLALNAKKSLQPSVPESIRPDPPT